MKNNLTGVLLLTLTLPVFASNNFKCTVLDSFTLEADGKADHKSNLALNALNKEFTVNRQTGQITGGGFVNTMSGQMPTVYDYLPSENGYKAITIYKPNHTVDYLQINEYVDNAKKPFIYKGAWGTIVTGLCVYY